MHNYHTYLYPNRLVAYLDSVAPETFRMFYQRPLIIYKGVDNLIQIDLRNQDQKKVISTNTLVITVLDPRTQLRVLSSDFTRNTNGTYETTLSETDLSGFSSGNYEFTLILEERQITDQGYVLLSSRVCYSDSQFDARGILELRDNVQGEIYDSFEIKHFKKVSPASVGETGPNRFESSVIETGSMAGPTKNSHTFQIYANNYTGSIDFQVSQDSDPRPGDWATLDSVTVVNQDSFYVNFEGIYKWFRVVHIPNSAFSVGEFVVQQSILNAYSVSIRNGGLGYQVGNVITISGSQLGGESPTNDLVITVASVNTIGAIQTISWSGLSYNGVKTYVVLGELTSVGTIDKILYR
jgi:hypothetical protein